jgi:hypothetical protein
MFDGELVVFRQWKVKRTWKEHRENNVCRQMRVRRKSLLVVYPQFVEYDFHTNLLVLGNCKKRSGCTYYSGTLNNFISPRG